MRDEIKEKKFEAWKHGLLDISKRNKLMNYRKTKRATLQITIPSMTELFKRLVHDGDTLSFRRQIDASDDLHLSQLFYIMDKMDAPVELAEGEIYSDLSVAEMNRTLKNLRLKARLSQEEQGINILYLCFGFLQWKQKHNDDYLISPLVLVPVSLELESILSPYRMKRLEEDIVINPTLEYALSFDFGIELPEFDPQEDDLDSFLDKVAQLVTKNGWAVQKEANIGLLSFLKIVMYKDLEKYKDRIFASPVVQAFCGDVSALPPVDESLKAFPHDTTPALDVCQVVNADASQQDAVLLSRNGISFVLQGPPGTGKSQTITNIISQALADKKTVLFVSEKMAALSVVYRRLKDVGLADYCLSLHNYKAERRAVIQDLVATLDAPTRSIKPGITDALAVLEEARAQLNAYISELNTIRQPMNATIYEVLTELATTETDYYFHTDEDVLSLSEAELSSRSLALKKLADFLSENGYGIYSDPWRGTSIVTVSYEIRDVITRKIGPLSAFLFGLSSTFSYINQECGLTCDWTLQDCKELINGLVSVLLSRRIAEDVTSRSGESILSGGGFENLTHKKDALVSSYQKAKNLRIRESALCDEESIDAELTNIQSRIDHASKSKSIISIVNSAFPEKVSNNKSGLLQSRLLISAARVPHPVMGVWFENNQYETLLSRIQEWMDLAEAAETIKKSIDQAWEKGFYSLEHDEFIRRFKDEYSGSFFDVHSLYGADIDTLEHARKGNGNLCTDGDYLSELERLKSYHTLLKSYTDGIESLPRIPNVYYEGIDADWDNAQKKLNECIGKVRSWMELSDKVKSFKTKIDAVWHSEFYGIDFDALIIRFGGEYTSFFKRMGSQYRTDKAYLASLRKNPSEKMSDTDYLSALVRLKGYHEAMAVYTMATADAPAYIGSYYQGNDTDWLSVLQTLSSYVPRIKELDVLSKRLAALKSTIESSWNPSFFMIDYEGLIQRFQNDYTPAFKTADEQYRADIETLDQVRKDRSARLQNQEYLAALELLQSYHAAQNRYAMSASDAAAFLGGLYHGASTDWASVIQILEDCQAVDAYQKSYPLSDELLRYLGKPYEERLQAFSRSASGTTYEQLLSQVEAELSFDDVTTDDYTYQLNCLTERENCLNGLQSAYTDAHSAVSAAHIMLAPEGTIASLLDVMDRLNRIGRTLSDMESRGLHCFSKVGLKSDAIPMLEELFEEHYSADVLGDRSAALAELAINHDADKFEAMSETAVEEIVVPFDYEETLSTFFSWFPNADLAGSSLQKLAERTNRCQDIEALQLWLRYDSIAKECTGHNMTAYLDFVEENNLPANAVIPTYRKSILSKWIFDLLSSAEISYLTNFHSYAHEKVIQDFEDCDEKQLQIAKARLLDQLSHDKPSGTNQLLSAMDEISILRREAEKKRRIIPLRKLFKTIPTLLQKLKPCFMMSPLSVSYFLDSEMYSFDMVIFDEASQILPEDAIGAIYRGKQVIIAGDTKQMPPTNFFSAAAKNTDDYDVDEDSDEYYPDIVSESILDEATTCLPPCTLLWHYRSKDESLIAFSNQQLYSNRLITFPNPSKLEDRGLEYIYVPNGYYEGSGKNCNVMEARKCLALVIEHIQKHPDRSLGIIAFSEKQQGVIEEVISDYRMKNPMFEDFFDESKDEPFFVKNLENVQGDERDTIIFSICYAKNAQGRMYQRFGPLGHDGGERRLNVAITRAKYNVKLVGSILPTDIQVKEGTKDGVRMLREYIYYAMQNDFTLAAGSEGEEDDPFTEHILSFLEHEGYHCVRNVGASQYRVDIAVQSPDQDDVYIAGIECDGRNYTNTRTARDRDVLRRSIMTSLGWKLYHVWSVAWFLNPEDEKRRLLEFLKRCSEEKHTIPQGEQLYLSPEFVPEEDDELTEILELADSEDTSRAVNTLRFDPYEISDPWQAPYSHDDDNYTNLVRRIMWVVEREQPIHIEELYRRLATVFGRQKATAPVRRTVDDCIQRRMKNMIVIRNDFIYLPNNAEVKARTPKFGDEPRPIEHICPEEIQDAMYRILDFAYGLPEKELFSETARQLGYARTGAKIVEVLESNYRQLLSAGRIKETDGKLYPVREDKA